MGYEEHSRTGSGSSAVVIAITVGLALVLLAGIAVVGVGALFWVRTGVREAHIAEMDARVAQERTRAEMKQLEADLQPPVALPEASPSIVPRELTITLDADGNITVDGESATVDRLKEILGEMQQGEAVSATVKADRRCDFGHVAAVQDACRESGIETVRFAVAE